MNPAQLLSHFDRISDAPDATPRLRRFILDLAVRGKLVEQDPKDALASELLERIQKEKEHLIQKGECRRQKDLPDARDEDTPFRCPSSWQWARLGLVTNITQGFAFSSEKFSNDKSVGLPLIKIGDIGSNNPTVFVRGEYEDIYLVKPGDLLLGLSGSIKCAAWKGPTALLNQRIARISPVPNGLAPRWLLFCVEKCIEIWISETSKLTVQNVKAGQLYEAVVPIPPLAEQQRIVAKVDELMALCDRLEAAQAERENRRDRLVGSSLNRLNNGADPDTFRNHARFYFSHLPRLTTKPEHIQQLRQTILNLAVRGKLVPQDPNEESATHLLVQLMDNAKSYALEHSIASPSPDPITKESIEFPAPPGWKWVRLTSLFKVITDGDHQPPPKADEGIAFLTIGNITTGKLDFTNCRFVGKKYWKSLAPYKKPVFGDILYTVVGATYGRPAYVDSRRPFCVQRHIAILKPTDQMNVRFLCSLLASPLVYEQATRSTTGTAQPTIPIRPLRNFLVLLPPLAEQHRIVAKVDELMALCDKLEAQLTTTQTESRRLLEAVLHEALTETNRQELAGTSCRSSIQETESR